jgi:hypothetical protein
MRREYYYFICGINKKGRPFVLGSYTDEEQAKNDGYEQCSDIQWEIKEYRTSQLSVASAMWKAELSKRYRNIDIGFQRASHQTDNNTIEGEYYDY